MESIEINPDVIEAKYRKHPMRKAHEDLEKKVRAERSRYKDYKFDQIFDVKEAEYAD